MLTRKIKFANGSWIILIQANGYVCEVHSNGMMQTKLDSRTMTEIANELIIKLRPVRGEVQTDETKNS